LAGGRREWVHRDEALPQERRNERQFLAPGPELPDDSAHRAHPDRQGRRGASADERHRLAVARVHRDERARALWAAEREPGSETAWQRVQSLEVQALQELLERLAARVQALPVGARQQAAREPGSEMALEPGRPQVELEQRLLVHWGERAEPMDEPEEQREQRPKRPAQELAAQPAEPAVLREPQA